MSILTWNKLLFSEFKKKYMKELIYFLINSKKRGNFIYPEKSNIFKSLKLSSFNDTKVIILGQDPYINFNQANGLSFSVNHGIKIPLSLRNIYKEIYNDLGILAPTHGDLTRWAKQGVLLLNSILTVEANLKLSHSNKGWEIFTNKIIYELNNKKDHLVFLLWGNHAQKKGLLINKNKHLVLNAAHPSPLSANRGFFGCKHFSETNDYLIKHHNIKINWNLND
jgi:uracil-DNA glycosylase